MKNKISNFLLTLTVTFVGLIGCSNSSTNHNISQNDISHQSETYFCDDQTFEHPNIVFRSDLGNARLIQFQYDANRDWYLDNPNWTPLDRCHEIAERFQEFQELDIISYLTVENMPTGDKAICISKEDADHLQLLKDNPEFVRLVITVINPNDNAKEILKEMKGISAYDSDAEPMNG